MLSHCDTWPRHDLRKEAAKMPAVRETVGLLALI